MKVVQFCHCYSLLHFLTIVNYRYYVVHIINGFLCNNKFDETVQIDGGLFVRLCKSTGVCLPACAKMTGVYLSGGLFVRDSKITSVKCL